MKSREYMTPAEVRMLIRTGQWQGPTAGAARGYTQANVLILPQEYAYDFTIFCLRNPKPCPLIEVLDPGDPVVRTTASGADVRTDIPKYRVYEHGILKGEMDNIKKIWRSDLVTFLVGCSFTFENALLSAGVPLRHVEERKAVPMYVTNIECEKSSILQTKMIVSMRPLPKDKVVRAIQVTSRFPTMHGAPVHIGDPLDIGIRDVSRPDFGEPVTIHDHEVPVFWACGGTVFNVATTIPSDLVITHAPSRMLVLDTRDEEFAVF